ncbi:MAG: ribose-phosphate pyrophosphokinase [Alphaproteobacteria bacterium]|nr:ribose-phosphate pyrophosphokinase [Alphaproteobacteria bacterium]
MIATAFWCSADARSLFPRDRLSPTQLDRLVHFSSLDTDKHPDGEVRILPADAAESHHCSVTDEALLIQTVNLGARNAQDRALLEIAMTADAVRSMCPRARLTLVMPYIPYLRQDRRHPAGTALGSAVVGRLLRASGIDRIVTVDPHFQQAEAALGVPTMMLDPAPSLAQRVFRAASSLNEPTEGWVVVAPDAGAAKRAERFLDALNVTVTEAMAAADGSVASFWRKPIELTVGRKERLPGRTAQVTHLVLPEGLRGKGVIIVDDILDTGGTITSAAAAAWAGGSVRGATIAAVTHPLCSPGAREAMPAEMPVIALDTVVPCERIATLELVPAWALLSRAF